MIFTLVAFIFALGLLVLIHELGHYSVARWCGVKVLRFSLGFGPVLFVKKDKNNTEWVISAIPLGGYVKMLDTREGEVSDTELSSAFNHKTVYQRFAIVVAGPLANLILAASLYAGISWWGVPEPLALLEEPPVGSIAQQKGIQKGDLITEVNGQQVQSWSDAAWLLLKSATDQNSADLTIKKSSTGEHRTLNVDFSSTSMSEPDSNPLGDVGLSLLIPQAKVERLSESAVKGLLPGDIILSINGRSANVKDFLEQISASPNQQLNLEILRNQHKENISITTMSVFDKQSNKNIGKIGVYLSAERQQVVTRKGLLDGLVHGVQRTYEVSVFSLSMLIKMISGDVSWKNLSGPITIADYAGQTARLGVLDYMAFIALVSISLGVLNLLPVPVLDGGHLVLYIIEMVKGTPVSEVWVERGQRVGMILILMLMFVALFNDVTRLLITTN